MNIEMIWLSAPIAGLLSQIGGTCWKLARRLLIAIMLAGSYLYFFGFSWLIILFIILQCAVYTLPFTLTGDSVDKPIDWIWIPVKGILMSSPSLILNPSIWVIMIICAFIWAILAILSNVKKTARYFPWKMVEIFHGMMPAICFCYAVTIKG
jgi:hypothetical protein